MLPLNSFDDDIRKLGDVCHLQDAAGVVVVRPPYHVAGLKSLAETADVAIGVDQPDPRSQVDEGLTVERWGRADRGKPTIVILGPDGTVLRVVVGAANLAEALK